MSVKIQLNSKLSLFVIGIVLICSLMGGAAAGSSLTPFEPDSLRKIEELHANKPFLLVLWSLDCPPCRKELDLLSKIRKRRPDLPLVLISTDTVESSGQLASVLASHQLDKVESWFFSDAGSDRLRYEIDPNWFGEIPRSYFYDRNHQRTGVSGALKTAEIESWLDSVRR